MRIFILFVFVCGLNNLNAQFHSLSIPKVSPRVESTYSIGATRVKIAFGSPSVQGRDVWNNQHVIPQQGKPYPWRAGANENTVISFDTDVFIEDIPLPAGSYGFHVIPNGHLHTLLFAELDNLWGSYYLNIEKDVVLKVVVEDSTCAFSEQMNFELVNTTESRAIVALKWADRVIPFEVSVDLNKTVLEKLRYELNGENTYRWRAWNDAAAWCVRRNTNLEEALIWVNRSIGGGYGGFGGDQNMVNLGTKIKVLQALGEPKELDQTFELALSQPYSIDDAHHFGGMLIEINEPNKAIDFYSESLKKYKNEWGIQYMISIAYYESGNTKKAKIYLNKCKDNAPDFFHQRVDITLSQMDDNSYVYPRT